MGQLGRDVGTESVFSFLKMADVTTYQYTDGTDPAEGNIVMQEMEGEQTLQAHP